MRLEMSSEKQIEFTKENIDTYLKKVVKAFPQTIHKSGAKFTRYYSNNHLKRSEWKSAEKEKQHFSILFFYRIFKRPDERLCVNEIVLNSCPKTALKYGTCQSMQATP